jgi:hypothetical protein
MDVLPLWVSGLGLAVLLPLTVQVGYRLHVRGVRRTRHPLEGDGGDWAMIVSVALTLIALLVSFTVSMAVDQYEHPRQVVNDQAKAVSTTDLRTGLFAPPAADRLSAPTARYARDRRAATLAGDDMKARAPARILLMLVAYAAATAAMLGYGLGARRRRHLAGSALLFLVMTMTDLLILDLRRPGSGGVTTSQTPMDRLNAAIAQWELLRRQGPHSDSDHKERS